LYASGNWRVCMPDVSVSWRLYRRRDKRTARFAVIKCISVKLVPFCMKNAWLLHDLAKCFDVIYCIFWYTAFFLDVTRTSAYFSWVNNLPQLAGLAGNKGRWGAQAISLCSPRLDQRMGFVVRLSHRLAIREVQIGKSEISTPHIVPLLYFDRTMSLPNLYEIWACLEMPKNRFLL